MLNHPAKKIKNLLGILFLLVITLLIIFITGTASRTQTVLINEICSNNFSILQNASGDYADYIELYNTGDSDVSIEGWTLHTESELSEFYTFGDIVLEPHAYLLLVQSSEASASTTGSIVVPTGKSISLSVPCAVASSGETVYLRNSVEKTVDAVDVPALQYNTAYARSTDAADNWDVFLPSPGATNESEAVFTSSFFEKDTTAPVYDENDLALPSDETMGFSILSISIPEETLWDTDGIFLPEQVLLAGREYERECRIDYFSSGEGYTFSQNVGMRVSGSSDNLAHLNLKLYARDIYDGKSSFAGNFFTSENATNKVFLRYFGTKEHLILSLLREGGFSVAASTPCTVFINGTFYGKYYISEICDENYISSTYDVKAEDITLLVDGRLESGSDYSRLEYQNLINTACSLPLSDKTNYNRIVSQLDLDSLLNYYAVSLYFNNYDLAPYNECIVWRDEAGDKKWHYEITGLDTALTDFFTGNAIDTDTLSYILAEDPLFASLIQNDDFCLALYDKIDTLAKITCSTENVATLLSEGNYFSENSEQIYADLLFFSEARTDFILSYLESIGES